MRPDIDPVLTRRNRHLERLARLITDVLCPPVLAVFAFLLAARSDGSRDAYLWALLSLLLPVGIPCLYVFWLVAQGKVTDFHLNVREQRYRPLAVALFSSGAAILLLWLGHAPRLLLLLMLTALIQALIFTLITLRWKISGHTAGMANLAILGGSLVGWMPLWVLGVPMVAWARVYLRRHTIWQTVAGSLLGAAIMLLALQFLPK